MTRRARLGLIGGTFDPIHFGHLDAAIAAAAALGLDRVQFVPAHDPPHRSAEPHATAFHRFALVALGIQGHDGWEASDLELQRSGPSYTIDTLRALHAEGWEPSQIFFIIGADAFAEIGTWRSFPQVLDAASFVVVARPGTTLESALARAPALRERVADVAGCHDREAPAVYLVEAQTRDVSSSLIRARLASGAPIDDLVPAAVADYIRAHHLYRAVDHLHGKDEGHHASHEVDNEAERRRDDACQEDSSTQRRSERHSGG